MPYIRLRDFINIFSISRTRNNVQQFNIFFRNNENYNDNNFVTVNFRNRNLINLREIINNTNFQNIPNNNPQTILNEVISRYPILNSVRQNLRILRTSPRNAYIYNFLDIDINNENNYFICLILNQQNNGEDLQNIRDIITSNTPNINIFPIYYINNINDEIFSDLLSRFISTNIIARSISRFTRNSVFAVQNYELLFRNNNDNSRIIGLRVFFSLVNSNYNNNDIIGINYIFSQNEQNVELIELSSVIFDTNFQNISNNNPQTILNEIISRYPQLINQIRVANITDNSAVIHPALNSSYFGNVTINFTIKNNNISKKMKINNSDSDSDDDNPAKKIIRLLCSSSKNNKKSNIIIRQDYNKSDCNLQSNTGTGFKKRTNAYNAMSKEEKQQKLNEINQHYQNLSENDKKVFKDKLRDVGLGLTSTGISGAGILGISKMTGTSPIKGLTTAANYIKNSLSSTRGAVSTGTGETMEMTPLLSESTVAEGLTAAETLSITEGTAVIATEGAVIGAEASTAAALAPETLGLSLVIGGLVIAGTAILWWINSDHTAVTKHESHNKYNEIEKYYKFLAHDQLKLDININEWNKIKQIYQENSNNFQEFKNKIKSEIINFHKEDHSGWGGSITDDDKNTLINILYNHFQEINNHFSSNHNHGWKIVTNTIGSYFIIEEE